MVRYGIRDLYSAIVANVSNVLCTLVHREQPSFQARLKEPKYEHKGQMMMVTANMRSE